MPTVKRTFRTSEPWNREQFKCPLNQAGDAFCNPWRRSSKNHAHKDWPEIFNNDTPLTSAILDRLLHHAETVLIEGRSNCMKDQAESCSPDLPLPEPSSRFRQPSLLTKYRCIFNPTILRHFHIHADRIKQLHNHSNQTWFSKMKHGLRSWVSSRTLVWGNERD